MVQRLSGSAKCFWTFGVVSWSGLSPIMVETIFDVIRSLSASGMTILLVEQNARLALQIANRAYVMESGLITLSGTGKELLEDPRVRAAYLGE